MYFLTVLALLFETTKTLPKLGRVMMTTMALTLILWMIGLSIWFSSYTTETLTQMDTLPGRRVFATVMWFLSFIKTVGLGKEWVW